MVKTWTAINERIILLEMNPLGNDIKFKEKLTDVLEKTENRNQVCLMGDFNSRFGKKVK